MPPRAQLTENERVPATLSERPRFDTVLYEIHHAANVVLASIVGTSITIGVGRTLPDDALMAGASERAHP